MAVTIEEVSAEIAPAEQGAEPAPQAASKPSPATERRRLGEDLQHLQRRAARVAAN